MQTVLLFVLGVTGGLLAWFTIFATFAWPRLRQLPKADQLRALAAVHFFRYFGTTFLITGLVVHKLPGGFANPAAYGDLLAVALAYVVFVTLRGSQPRYWTAWLFNIWGTVDLLLAAVTGPLLIKNLGDFGLAYIIPTVYVPMLFAAHFYAFKALTAHSKA